MKITELLGGAVHFSAVPHRVGMVVYCFRLHGAWLGARRHWLGFVSK